MSCWRQAVTTVATAGLNSLCGWGGRLGVIIESNLNRVRVSCCWVGVRLGCYNNVVAEVSVDPNLTISGGPGIPPTGCQHLTVLPYDRLLGSKIHENRIINTRDMCTSSSEFNQSHSLPSVTNLTIIIETWQ